MIYDLGEVMIRVLGRAPLELVKLLLAIRGGKHVKFIASNLDTTGKLA